MTNANTPTSSVEADSVDLRGYLAHNWLAFDGEPFVVNPSARPGDLLAWCWGEVVSLLAAADVAIESSQHTISTDDLSAIFVHRLLPLKRVLSHTISVMAGEQRQADSGDEVDGNMCHSPSAEGGTPATTTTKPMRLVAATGKGRKGAPHGPATG